MAHTKRGKGLVRLNGVPIDLVQPDTLRLKAVEPILLLGKERFANVDIRIRVKGGGHVSEMYAVRQAVARSASMGRACSGAKTPRVWTIRLSRRGGEEGCEITQ